MNISLPKAMKTWVESRIERAGFGTASEYFRQLVREDQQRLVRGVVEAGLLEALESGEPEEITPNWWAERRRQVAATAKKRKSKR